MTADESWRDRAACRRADQAAFYPERCVPGVRVDRRYVYALAICARCPVTAECLAYVMAYETDSRTRYGMWGGLTPRQRTALARKQRTLVS